jgi:predicted phosphoribosyltransferase
MYYNDRTDLGNKLAIRLAELKAVEPVILCLKESSLSTAIALAAELRGWVYPLVCEEIKMEADDRIIGVIDSDGTYTVNPQLSSFELEDIMTEFHSIVEDKKREAFSRLNRSSADYAKLNPDVFNERVVILCGDVLKNQIHIGAARALLKPKRPITTIAVAGNVDVNAADYLRLTADQTQMMDVMSSMFDDDHYFEKTDPYTVEQKRQIAMNISQFWKPAKG